MAVEYHLITPFGLTTTVTVSSTNDRIELANHGMRTGQGFYFLSTSTALPKVGGVDVSISTCYYVSSTDNLSGSFKVTTNSDGSGTPLDFSSAGSSVKIAGKYWTELPTTDPGNGGNYKDRYLVSGSWSVHKSMNACYIAVNALTSDYSKDVVVEVEGAFTDLAGVGDFYAKWASLTLSTKVLGTWGSGFHGGVVGSGYVLSTSGTTDALITRNMKTLIEGMEANNTNASATVPGFRCIGPATTCSWCITKSGVGFYQSAVLLNLYYCIALECRTYGFRFFSTTGQEPGVVSNCLAAKCATGYYASSTSSTGGTFINNAAIGCTTANYGTAPAWGTNKNNAGISTDTPWGTGAITTMAADGSDFVGYAGNDFRPVSTSPLIDAAIEFSGLPARDIKNNPVPSYESATYPNNPRDIGPFEYDYGEGVAPEVLTISNLTTGSRVIATRADTGASLGTATESAGVATISIGYSGTVNVEARNASGTPAYKPWTTQISFPGTKSVIALQEVD